MWPYTDLPCLYHPEKGDVNSVIILKNHFVITGTYIFFVHIKISDVPLLLLYIKYITVCYFMFRFLYD